MSKCTYRKHLFIPDTQVKEDVPTDHLRALGRYILEKRPDVIIHAGDHWDMPSLSGYETAAWKGFVQADFDADVKAGNRGLALIDAEVDAWNRRRRERQRYKPEKHLTLGNHEFRIERAVRQEPWLRNTLLGQLETRDWTVHPFLAVVEADGVSYSHFFCRSADGKVKQTKRGQANARLQVQREGRSATAGHQQGLDTHIQPVGDGTRRRGLIAGSFYMHDEEYMSPQGQNHWRGVLVKHEVREGDYDLVETSMAYLLRAYT